MISRTPIGGSIKVLHYQRCEEFNEVDMFSFANVFIIYCLKMDADRDAVRLRSSLKVKL